MNNRNPQQTNQQPMRGMANQMATHGRYGDSMLVHMNPVEVQGLASLSPTGELTTNPMTGQPEAFLPFLLPLLGSLGGSAMAGGALATSLGLGSLGATAMGAIGSGLATTAVTGDIKEGIMSGLTGFGIGKAFQGASELLSPEVLGATTDLANVGADAAAAAELSLGAGAGEGALKQAANTITQAPATIELPAGQLGPQAPNFGSQAYRQEVLDAAKFDAGRAGSSAFAENPMEFAKKFGSQAITSGTMLPVAIGEGMRGQRMAEKDNERAIREYEQEKADTLARSTAVRDSAIQQARDDYAYQDYGYAGGGLVSVNPQEYMRQMNGVHTVGMNAGGPAEYNYAGMPGKGGNTSPASAGLKQRSVRPANVVTADQLAKEAAELSAQGKDPRAGFTGEINYFRKTPEEAGIPVPPDAVIDPTDPSGGNVDPSNPIDTGSGPISIGGKGGAMNLSPEEMKNLMDKMGPVGAGGAGSSEKPFIDPSATDPVRGGRRGNPRKPPLDVIKAKEAIDAIGAPEPIVPIYTPPKPTTDPSLYSDPIMGGGPMGGNPKTMPPMSPMPMPKPPMGGPMPPMPMPKPPMPMPMPPMGGPMPPMGGPMPPMGGPMPPAHVPMPPMPAPPMPAPPMPAPPMPKQKGPTRRMRFAGGVVNLQGGGIADIPQQEMAPNFNNPSLSNDPLIQQATAEAMPTASNPVLNMNESGQMGQGEAMEVAGQVAQALSQGVTIEQLPPELAQKLMLAIELFGMEAVQSMIMQPQGQAPQSYSFQEGGVTPSASPETQLIEQTISAVLGQLPQDQADIIINQFISEFGQEAFEMLREQALQSVVPNAQTEGVIRGQGGGMDDMVDGMIGTEQPVAVSPGEYIVPADVVSGLGDGSTDGGVTELDGMLDRVRQTRTGTTQQPAPMNSGGVLPA
jgi:hypothetical protein